MHGLSPFALQNLKGLAEKDKRQGLTNLFGELQADQIFTGHDLSDRSDADRELRAMLHALAARIMRERNKFWTEPVETTARIPGRAVENWENPDIPSGYTYFLQLVAHDLIASSVSLAVDSARAVVENSRTKQLVLDTIYGGGPDLCPHVYEYSVSHRDNNGQVPRIRLRVGPKCAPVSGATRCPARDIARGTATDTLDAGRDNGVRQKWRTEAMLADPRNDVHALLSQLTLLFHLLHNIFVEKLEKSAITNPRWSHVEIAYRRFLCARLAVTLTYRNIIKKDLLRLILHPQVYAAYSAGLFLDKSTDVPFEFSHGAFRFGHAMVRHSYRVNSVEHRDTFHALRQSSNRSPGFLPVKAEWHVDWPRFFEVDSTIAPNFSHRIGPDYPALFDERDDDRDVAYRDNLSAAYAGVWSVPKLFRKLIDLTGGTALAGVVVPYDVWKSPLESWLRESIGSASLPHQLTEDHIRRIVEDPPLVFFVMFEAAHELSAGEPIRKNGGRHLGVVGSIIAAETIYGALQRNKIRFETEPTLTRQIESVCKSILEDPTALGDTRVSGPGDTEPHAIESMRDLIIFLEAHGAFKA